jgi:hypothetical protein
MRVVEMWNFYTVHIQMFPVCALLRVNERNCWIIFMPVYRKKSPSKLMVSVNLIKVIWVNVFITSFTNVLQIKVIVFWNIFLRIYLLNDATRRDSIVGIAINYGLNDREFGIRVQWRSRIFSSPRRPGRPWGPIQPPIQWVSRAFSLGVMRPGVKLTTHELVPRSRKCGCIYPFPHAPSWRSV